MPTDFFANFQNSIDNKDRIFNGRALIADTILTHNQYPQALVDYIEELIAQEPKRNYVKFNQDDDDDKHISTKIPSYTGERNTDNTLRIITEENKEKSQYVKTIYLNKNSWRAMQDVLLYRREFSMFQSYAKGERNKYYVVHHGPGAPESVIKHINQGDFDNWQFISCNGASHPRRHQHILPSDYPLGVLFFYSCNAYGFELYHIVPA